jgi:hypothetical protein
MQKSPRRAAFIALAAAPLAVSLIASPANAEDGIDQRYDHAAAVRSTADGTVVPLVTSDNVGYVTSDPGAAGISGCFMTSAPLFVTSNLESIKVYDVSEPAAPVMVGVLPGLKFENEAMNCGERKTATGTERFVMIGVDLYEVSEDLAHANVGGGELVVVDVTDPTDPYIRSRAAGTTSTHTVACIDTADCKYAYSAGDTLEFSIFDLRDLDKPREVDADNAKDGVQPYASPTGGHKWNPDGAGYATHTGWNGTSLWDVERPRHPKLITTTGKAGAGEDPKFADYNNFIHHNSFRPNAKKFVKNAAPSVKNGNVLLVTEEDYEQTDCTQAGSFQTWHVQKVEGKKAKQMVPLDKVELSDLGTFNVPQYAFCSAHWFDYHPSGIVAVGYYGGGTQFIDVRDPKNIKSYGYAAWGASEVWDAMWVPHYLSNGQMARSKKTNIVYSIDLVRGLDVYTVTLPASPKLRAVSAPTRDADPSGILLAGAGLLLLGVGGLHSAAARRRRTAETV